MPKIVDTTIRLLSQDPLAGKLPTGEVLRIAEILGSVDTYSFVFDPYLPDVVVSQLSDDLASIATDLENGLRHYRVGDLAEALWWWQFSYLSDWGERAASALRVLQSLLSHIRLDADDETVADAEFDALHP